MATALNILHTYWKYPSFREPQEKIINLVINNTNTLAILPTGGGKSICYQIPALIKEGVCIVISPLIALMNDQVKALKEKGIKAIAITSAMRQDEIIDSFDNLRYGNYKFLYLSPEKLQSPFIQEKIKQLTINLIAIDEVHCISEWGHDFRPAYLKIPILNELHPNTPIIGLTATATTNVVKDIIKQLNIPNARVIKQSLVRKNLAFRVIHSEDFYYYIKNILDNTKLPTIIYVNSRKKTKNISDYLNRNNLKSTFYHGGLSLKEKERSFSNWMQEKTPIMIATNAFGMGIDKGNVGQIIHLDIPYSLENYVQEAGRAGRDGDNAFSYIFANKHSIENLKKHFLKSTVTVKLTEDVYKKINHYFHISYGEISERFFEFDLIDFCSHYKFNILQAYNTLKVLEREQVLIFDENFNQQSTLKIIVSPEEILHYSKKNKENIIQILLRSYGGLFEHYIKINETLIAKKIGTTPSVVKNAIIKLSNNGLVRYHFKSKISKIQFLVPREDALTIRKVIPNIKQQNSLKLTKMNAMIAYVANQDLCRSRFLLNYFDEKNSIDCGICDVCKKTASYDYKQLATEILALFSIKKTWTSKEVVARFSIDKDTVLSVLQMLLDTHKITLTSQHQLEKV